MTASHTTSPLAPLRRESPSTLTPRVLQFGSGNFLRGFADWMIDLLNERSDLDAGVVIVRPTGRSERPLMDAQDSLFTTLVRGLGADGQPVREFRRVSCVLTELDLHRQFEAYLASARVPTIRFVVSNTTEAGIAVNDSDRFDDRPPSSFPAKLTRWLHERFIAFDGTAASGVVVLPCELIDDNGPALLAAVRHFAALWQLAPAFDDWLLTHCAFHSTLVDRIVPGYPAEEMDAIEREIGAQDQFLVTAEPYSFWAIQAPAALGEELKLAGADLNLRLVDDIKPFKQRKVGILNGGHTTLVPVALLAGIESVGEALRDEAVRGFLVAALHEEIIPALPLPREELEPFAAEVMRRFGNPFIHHRLASIALNSWSKFAARVMPQLLRYRALRGEWPQRLVLALAATMHLYRGAHLTLSDDPATLDWFRQAWPRRDSGEWTWNDFAAAWLAHRPVWGEDLHAAHGDGKDGQPGLTAALAQALADIDEHGVRGVLATLSASTAPPAR